MLRPRDSSSPRFFSLSALLVLAVACAHVASAPPVEESSSEPLARATPEKAPGVAYTARGRRYVIVAEGPRAADAAKRALDAGGNIFDAAVAASFAISVERPHSTGIGGGGFAMVRLATGEAYAVDFRERAPGAATANMYLNAKGEADPAASQDGPRAGGVPGLVAGLVEVQNRFGTLPLGEVLKPAIALADQGFEVYPSLARALTARTAVLQQYPSSRAVFLKNDGKPYAVGERLVQKDLAQTLRQVARLGKKGFYAGDVARAFTETAKRDGALFTAADLGGYKVAWREPLRGTYKGREILAMPPPSSGGTHVLEILNILEPFPVGASPHAAQDMHLTASAMELAFRDRARYLGDADFVKVPVAGLISKNYAAQVRTKIDPEHALPDEPATGVDPAKYESPQTTHLTVMDAEGNVVSTTQTINGYMGSAYVVPGTGVVLNNEMDDFTAKVGAQNMFGAVGGEPNVIAPGKRPLSSMSPTIVLKDGKPVLALGAPGGTRILTCVTEVIRNYLDYGLSLEDSVAAVRYHHQWKPHELQIEKPGVAPAVEAALRAKGHVVKEVGSTCSVAAVALEKGELVGAADPRDQGAALAE